MYVGPERKHFSIHLGLLRTATCAFLVDKIGDEDSKEVCLAEEDAEVFEMFVSWLYTRKVKPITTKFIETDTNFRKDYPASVAAHVNLYLMAESKDLKSLKNSTMDRLREYSAAENMIIGSELCDLIYQQSKPDSLIRKYVVEQFLSHWVDKRRSPESAARLLRGAFKVKYGELFVIDICEGMRSKLKQKGWPTPNGKGCVFHDHEDGEGCEDEAGE